MARGIDDAEYRTLALAALGQHEEARRAAQGIGDERSRARALEALVPRLAEVGRVEEAMRLARGIGDAEYRARACRPWDNTRRRCGVARGIGDERSRARALEALANRLAEAGRVEEAIEWQGIRDEGHRAGALTALAHRLAEAGRVEEAMRVARGIATPSTGPVPWRPWRTAWPRRAVSRRRSCCAGDPRRRVQVPCPGGPGAPPGRGGPRRGGACAWSAGSAMSEPCPAPWRPWRTA